MSRRVALVLTAILVATAAMTVAAVDHAAAGVPTVASILDVPLPPAGDGVECQDCSQGGCTSGYHKLIGITPPMGDDTQGEDPHTCAFGFCSAAHPPCDGGLATLDAEDRSDLWNAIVIEQVADVASLMNSLGESVQYNAVRQAVQVTGCDGNIVLSVPLTETQASELALALD